MVFQISTIQIPITQNYIIFDLFNSSNSRFIVSSTVLPSRTFVGQLLSLGIKITVCVYVCVRLVRLYFCGHPVAITTVLGGGHCGATSMLGQGP